MRTNKSGARGSATLPKETLLERENMDDLEWPTTERFGDSGIRRRDKLEMATEMESSDEASSSEVGIGG